MRDEDWTFAKPSAVERNSRLRSALQLTRADYTMLYRFLTRLDMQPEPYCYGRINKTVLWIDPYDVMAANDCRYLLMIRPDDRAICFVLDRRKRFESNNSRFRFRLPCARSVGYPFNSQQIRSCTFLDFSNAKQD